MRKCSGSYSAELTMEYIREPSHSPTADGGGRSGDVTCSRTARTSHSHLLTGAYLCCDSVTLKACPNMDISLHHALQKHCLPVQKTAMSGSQFRAEVENT